MYLENPALHPHDFSGTVSVRQDFPGKRLVPNRNLSDSRNNNSNRRSSSKRSGKTYFITGGASGLGEATVRRLHSEGANVAIADRDAGKTF